MPVDLQANQIEPYKSDLTGIYLVLYFLPSLIISCI